MLIFNFFFFFLFAFFQVGFLVLFSFYLGVCVRVFVCVCMCVHVDKTILCGHESSYEIKCTVCCCMPEYMCLQCCSKLQITRGQNACKQASINVSTYDNVCVCLHIFVDFRFVLFCFALLLTTTTHCRLASTTIILRNTCNCIQKQDFLLLIVVVAVACLFEYLVVKLRLSEYCV